MQHKVLHKVLHKPKLGSWAYADAYGVHGDDSIVKVLPSNVCEGNGLFSTRRISKGTPITRYHGRIVGSKEYQTLTPLETAYTYMIVQKTRKVYLVGYKNVDELAGKGVAQLANDAIHHELTGLHNNCRFEERGHRVYLVAKRDIAPNEELLVSYHISYWIETVRYQHVGVCIALPDHVRFWISCHLALEDLLRKRLHRKKLEIDAYHGLRTDVNENKETIGVVTYSISLNSSAEPTSDCCRCKCKCLSSTAMVRWSLLLKKDEHDNETAAAKVTHVSYKCSTCNMDEFVWIGTIDGVSAGSVLPHADSVLPHADSVLPHADSVLPHADSVYNNHHVL
jgi:SET domain